MKARPLGEQGEEDEHDPLKLSAARFSRTPLGRVVLHLDCLCHHPAAARFYVKGLTRNLSELIVSMTGAAMRFLRNPGSSPR